VEGSVEKKPSTSPKRFGRQQLAHQRRLDQRGGQEMSSDGS
jgi:hypothetical protein